MIVIKVFGLSWFDLLLLLVDHIIDLLLFDEKVEMMNYIYSLKMITPNSLPYFIKQYFEKKLVVTKRFTGIILFKQEKIKIMKDDFVIVSSDGLFDNLDHKEIELICQKVEKIICYWKKSIP